MAERLREGTPAEVGMSGWRIGHVAQLARRWVDEGHASGLVLLVARHGRIVLHEAFGRLTPDPDAPALPRDALFGVASITKPIWATSVLCLVEDGLVGLNRPVQEYIPEFVGPGKDTVLVRHLLTHTSGIRGEDVDAYARRQLGSGERTFPIGDQHPGVAQRLPVVYEAPLGMPPGVEMVYSTDGYLLLGEIVRRVSGKPVAAFLASRLFGPLGMSDTSCGLPASRQHRLARRYSQGGPVPPAAYAAAIDAGDDYGVYTAALDLAVFGQMFLQHGSYGDARVLSPASVAAMTRNQIPGIASTFGAERFREASWGLGWEVQGERHPIRGPSLISPRTFAHAGLGGTYLWIDPDNAIVGVYLSLLRQPSPWLRPYWNGDLVVDAIMAAIED